MKKGERAELSAKWWHASQPEGLASAARLEAALKSYEAALSKLHAHGSREALDPALDALDAVASATKAVITEAGKARNAPEMAATMQALDRLDLRKERARAAAEVHDEDDEEEDDEDDADGIAGKDEYRDYLLKSMKKLKNGAMNFGLVLGSKAVSHRLVLHRRKAAKTLAMHLVKELRLRQFSFGVAVPSEDRPQTLLLNVEGHVLPGMRKKIERMVKEFRPLPFIHIALFVSGKEIDEDPGADDEDDEGGDDEVTNDDDAPDDAAPDDTAPRSEAAGDADQAERPLDEVEPDDADDQHAAPSATRSESAPVRLKQDMLAIDPAIRLVFRRRVELRKPIIAAVSAFVAAINGGDLATAQQQMGRVKTLIAPYQKAAKPEPTA